MSDLQANHSNAFASMRGHHVAIRVRDFEASKKWFVDKLDVRVLKVWTFKNRQHA
jgi:catechol 2,3-dioxygenase-like lactoylglutathione lyase family enzyme